MEKEDISSVDTLVFVLIFFSLLTVASSFIGGVAYEVMWLTMLTTAIIFGGIATIVGAVYSYKKINQPGLSKKPWSTSVTSAAIWVAPLMIWYTPTFARIHLFSVIFGTVNLLFWAFIMLRYYWGFTATSKNITKVRDIFYKVWWPINLLYYVSVAAIIGENLLAG